MYQTIQNDPFATAMDPVLPSSTYVGKMGVNAWYCSLIKGMQKQPYVEGALDPNTGKLARRNTAIDLSLEPITDQPMEPIIRQALAEFGDWVDITLPSLKDVGITSLQSLNQAWVKVELTPTGSYINKEGKTKTSTCFKIVAVYENEAAARAAWAAENGGTVANAAPASQPGNGNGNNEKATALKFCGAYVKNALRQASGDLAKAQEILGPMLAQQPLIAKYFTASSPEVMDLLAKG